ncbi:MAG: L-threonylcarbamoyladenylate synthase [Acidimicrobiia bacterium]|nr:threonylcarbamoyl-AMP synthase [Acidimicrobiia bacterium]
MDLERIVPLLTAGEVVGLPTDTVYGIAADPASKAAVDKLFAIKGRGLGKPIGLLLASLAETIEVVHLPPYALEWAERYWPGPLNLVAAPLVELAIGTHDSLAVRVPAHKTTLAILSAFGPLAVTSANLADGPESRSDTDARALLGDSVAFYIPGTSPGGRASTTVDVRGPEPVLLRPGPIAL